MNNLIDIVEIGFGVLFIIGAIFHTLYTLRHGKALYGNFANNAWLDLYRTIIWKLVIPHTTVFTILLIIFQMSVGLMILTRGSLIEEGLFAGAAFSLAIIPASNTRGILANSGLAAVLVVLALLRL